MPPFLIDTHSHLHFPAYDTDREAVLERMRAKRIWTITIGTSLANSQAGVEFAKAHQDVWATVGLHPSHVTSEHLDEQEGSVHEHDIDQAALEALAQSSKKVVAIGEAGLDFYRLDTHADPEKAKHEQERVFRAHLAVARALDLPVMIHCRDGLVRLAEIMQDMWSDGWKPRAIVHSFTGTWTEAKPLIDLGLMIAVNGIAGFPLRKGQDPENAIDRTIERIPFDQLLLETDAPYLAPAPYRGKRNEPVYVEEVAKHVARMREVPFERVAEVTTENALKMFRLPAS